MQAKRGRRTNTRIDQKYEKHTNRQLTDHLNHFHYHFAVVALFFAFYPFKGFSLLLFYMRGQHNWTIQVLFTFDCSSKLEL